MTTIGKVMSKPVHSIEPSQKLTNAKEQMRKFGVRHLAVRSGGKLVGILSERDILFLEGFPGVHVETSTVEDAMMSEPFFTDSSADLKKVALEMYKSKYGAALVVDKDELVGIFTGIDALKILSELTIPA